MPRDGSGTYTYPPGTRGTPATPIESLKHNNYIDDVAIDLNTPRPIVAGGTGATNVSDAMMTLKGDVAYQVVTNYDSYLWVSGSFYSAVGATNAPVNSHAFTGICYSSDPAVVPPALPINQNCVLEARDESDTIVPGRKYVREKKAGVWGVWKVDGRTIIGDAEGIGTDTADMFFGVKGTAPTSSFIVNSESDASGTNLIQATKAGVLTLNGATQINGTLSTTSGTLSITGIISASGNITAGGNITAAGNVTATGSVFGNSVSSTTTVAATTSISAGTNITAGGSITATGDFWANNGVVRFRGDPTNTYIYHDGSSFICSHNFSAPQLTAGTMSLNGSNYAVTDGSNYLIRSGNAIYFQNNAAGNWGYVSGAGLTMLVGGISTPGSFSATGNITASGYVQAAGGPIYTDFNGLIAQGTTGGYTVFLCRGNPAYADMAFQALHFPGVWAGFNWTFQSVQWSFRQDGGAYKAGGGSWAAVSDARVKNVIGDYTSGLDAVASLRPVHYTYKGNDTYEPPSHFERGHQAKEGEEQPKGEPTVPYVNSPHGGVAKNGTKFIGLIAQEAETIMPELVSQSLGYIDGVAVTDFRNMDTGPLVFALINAVKELKARVEELEAAP